MNFSTLSELIAQARSSDELDGCAANLWRLFAGNQISDDQATMLTETIAARRVGLLAHKPREITASAERQPTINPDANRTLTANDPTLSKPVEASNRRKKPDGFFSIDRGAFRCAAAVGLNPAIAHLLLARGTGRDNRTTQWSVHSIEQWTGISRPNAIRAVADLLKRGIWKRVRAGKHPIYEAIPGNQIPGGPFTANEQEALAAIRTGTALSYEFDSSGEMLVARRLAKKPQGRKHGRHVELDEAAISALAEPMAVWLPNTLIDGAADEVPPVELIRQTHSLPALRLLIELYAVQFLPHFGGVPRDLLHVIFDRAKIGEQGHFIVWGFKEKHTLSSWDLAKHFMTGKIEMKTDVGRVDVGWRGSFWPAVETLIDLGLIERVGMLLDGDDAEAEIIHPYAIRGGEPEERELAAAARTVAQAMVTHGQLTWSDQEGYYQRLVPVRRHIANVAMVEVIRLKYRPHTKATAAWYAQMQQTTAEYLSRYQALSRNRHTTISAA